MACEPSKLQNAAYPGLHARKSDPLAGMPVRLKENQTRKQGQNHDRAQQVRVLPSAKQAYTIGRPGALAKSDTIE